VAYVKQKLWGGAFSKGPDPLAWSFGQSIDSDSELWASELDVSTAHVKMLGETGIITSEEAGQLECGLNAVGKSILADHEKNGGTWGDVFSRLAPDSEDVHAAIESLLEKEAGPVAGKLHAGRSRNDLVATTTKVWLRAQCQILRRRIRETQRTLLSLSRRHRADPMPGFTHMQSAQPVTLGFHLLAYFWMLQRDVERVAALERCLRFSPLGSAALAGTSLPIDRHFTARELAFEGPMPNALDATSDRDFVGDALHVCAMLMQHLSRLSQELVLWSGPMYGFVKLDEGVTTGSSIMPQKRNPDMAELIRGRSARVIGHWTAFMSMMKALPLGYNRDQQEDKPPLFDSFNLCIESLVLSARMLETAKFNLERMAAVAGDGFATATGVAEALVKEGVAFRSAHEQTGKLVRMCEEQGVSLPDLEVDDIAAQRAVRNATVEQSIASRNSYGGPAPGAMDIQIEEAEALLCHPDEGGISSATTHLTPPQGDPSQARDDKKRKD